ncbi:MAG: type II secretion system F family protein [Elusimicrobiota bacterium]|jgi:tight adherence protein C|nr:type II secretion system F family protein [Elusimicrobiota bacterium]
MIILIVLCASIGAFFFAKCLLGNLKSIEREGQVYNAASDKKTISFMPSILRYADKLGARLTKIKHPKLKAYMDKLYKDFIMLGGFYEKLNTHQFLAMQIFAAAAGIIICMLIITTDLFFILIAAAISSALPYLYIKEMASKKKAAISKQLPDFADLLSVMLESGSDFFSAADKITKILKGPLSDEFSCAILKISFGYDKKNALLDMSQKCGVEELRSFVRTVNLALDAGVGMSDTLERLAQQLRDEKAYKAEKKAQEAPVKILIPLVLFIFPTIFIVIFGPIAISFITKGGF